MSCFALVGKSKKPWMPRLYYVCRPCPKKKPIPHWELSQDRGIGCQSLTFFLLSLAERTDHIAFYSTIGVRYALSVTPSTTPTMTARTALA